MISIKFFDGAFGTYYMELTGGAGNCELANLNDKSRVLAIHKEYIRSGANAIKTNTFRANPEIFPDYEIMKRIITEGYAIAHEAAATVPLTAEADAVDFKNRDGSAVEVFADIGAVSDAELYLPVVDIFLDAGAVNFLFETLSSFDGIAEAAARIKERVKNSTVIVSFAVTQDGYSGRGIYYKNLIKQAAGCEDVDIVGLNCVCGPSHLLNSARALEDIKKPLSIMLNAGYPTVVDGRLSYNDNAEYFAKKLLEISRLKIAVLGGCCGTTPKHIKRAIELIKAEKNNFAADEFITPEKILTADKINPLGKIYAKPNTEEKYNRQPRNERLTTENYTQDSNSKIISRPLIYVELDPPPNGDFSFLFSSADMLKQHGVEAITLADSPLSRPGADSVLTAAKLKTEKGMDILPHITCRDKNSIALRGSLSGAYAFGINKVLVVTGDRLTNTSVSANDAVFSFNSVGLISYINNLNRELFSARPFSIGGALNVNAANFEAELNRAKQKIENGACFLLTQAIFSEEAVKNFIRSKRELDCKLFAGIMPVVSYKNAVFLNNEVAGIKIPQTVIDSFKGKKDTVSISINYCAEIIKSVSGYADGFYIMTPLKKTELVCKLIKRCFG